MRAKEGRQGGKVEVLLHLPSSLPTNSTLESSPNMFISVSSTDSDPPPLPMKKLHLKLQVQSYIVFKYQANLTLHLIKAGEGGNHHSLQISLNCVLVVEGQILSFGLISF